MICTACGTELQENNKFSVVNTIGPAGIDKSRTASESHHCLTYCSEMLSLSAEDLGAIRRALY